MMGESLCCINSEALNSSRCLSPESHYYGRVKKRQDKSHNIERFARINQHKGRIALVMTNCYFKGLLEAEKPLTESQG